MPPAADTPGTEEEKAETQAASAETPRGAETPEPECGARGSALRNRHRNNWRTAPRISRQSRGLESTPAPIHAEWDPSTIQIEAVEGKTRFQDFDLPPEIMHAVADLGFEYCTPIQAEILPDALQGKDATGKAQTGTGKTAAFLITIFVNCSATPPRRRFGTGPRGRW